MAKKGGCVRKVCTDRNKPDRFVGYDSQGNIVGFVEIYRVEGRTKSRIQSINGRIIHEPHPSKG